MPTEPEDASRTLDAETHVAPDVPYFVIIGLATVLALILAIYLWTERAEILRLIRLTPI